MHARASDLATDRAFTNGLLLTLLAFVSGAALATRDYRPAHTGASLDTHWGVSDIQHDLDTAPRGRETDDEWLERHFNTFRAARARSEQ